MLYAPIQRNRVADHSPRTSSLRFPEPRLRRYTESSRAPLERRMRCVFKDANCFELLYLGISLKVI